MERDVKERGGVLSERLSGGEVDVRARGGPSGMGLIFTPRDW